VRKIRLLTGGDPVKEEEKEDYIKSSTDENVTSIKTPIEYKVLPKYFFDQLGSYMLAKIKAINR